MNEGEGWALQAVATPGHTANHLAFAWQPRKISFVGDHVMGWSTSIVAPPDGSMIDYMASLERLTQRDEDFYLSGHGPEIPEGPRYVRFLIRHRRAREASILHRLAKGEADIPTIVRAIYIGIDPRLTGAAGYSVLAHLEDLVARGIVATDGDPVIGGGGDRHVFAESHDRRPGHRLDAADAARRLRWTLVDPQPFAPGNELPGDLIGPLHGHVEFHRLDVGIGQPLLFGGIQPGIDGGVGAVAGAQRRQRLERRRINRIGNYVMDRRQLVGLQAEIGRVGEHSGI